MTVFVLEKVQKGLHEFLFKLLILRYLLDSEGKMWKCNNKQLYLVEILESTVKSGRNVSLQVRVFMNTNIHDLLSDLELFFTLSCVFLFFSYRLKKSKAHSLICSQIFSADHPKRY